MIELLNAIINTFTLFGGISLFMLTAAIELVPKESPRLWKNMKIMFVCFLVWVFYLLATPKEQVLNLIHNSAIYGKLGLIYIFIETLLIFRKEKNHG